MNKLLNFAILLFVVLEYFSFFYTILRQTLVPSLKKQIKLIGLIFIILLIFSSFNFQRTTLYYIGLALSILLTNILFESSVKDILKLYIVSFPTLSIFESVVIYIIQSISDMGEKGNALPCLIIIIIILWLYYLLIGKNLNKDAFQITEHVWLIVASVMIILCLLITYFTFLLTEIIVPKGKLIGIVLITSGSLTIFILNYIILLCKIAFFSLHSGGFCHYCNEGMPLARLFPYIAVISVTIAFSPYIMPILASIELMFFLKSQTKKIFSPT